ncbi:MAG: immunoglobulin domain-containing protein [Opitutaceae bacterium]|nr:immunoglobulin domain-containing protein [Opitutaceae bacterium]
MPIPSLGKLTVCLAVMGALNSSGWAQIPVQIIGTKTLTYSQSSASNQSVLNGTFTFRVMFAADVPATTTVSVRGAVAYTIPRSSATVYSGILTYASEGALDVAFPDGNYNIVVSGNGNDSSTPVIVSSRPQIPPPRIANWEALQAVVDNSITVNWTPIVTATPADSLNITVSRGATQLYTTIGLGLQNVLNGSSTTHTTSEFSLNPGDALTGGLVLTRTLVSSANAGVTTIGMGSGFTLQFPIQRIAAIRPAIVSQPQPVTIAAGGTAALNVNATGTALAFQWRKDNLPIPGATSPTLILTNAQPIDAGNYSVEVRNNLASVASQGAALSIFTPATGAAPARIANLAIRSPTGTGAQTLIVGFVVGGAGAKPLLVRAAGPALGAFGLSGFLEDPKLEVFSSGTRIAENDNWAGDAQVVAASTRLGAFSLGGPASRDAALYLPAASAGSYTAQVSGVGFGAGVALAEIYDATPPEEFTATTARLINVAARSVVGTGGDVLIAGFVVAGQSSRTLLIRAIGPSLAGFGVTGTLADPQLAVFSGAEKIFENDDWGGAPAIAGAFSSVGAFQLPNGSRDSALVLTLPPGSYTAQVAGAGNTSGIALVEVYEVP